MSPEFIQKAYPYKKIKKDIDINFQKNKGKNIFLFNNVVVNNEYFARKIVENFAKTPEKRLSSIF